MPDELPPELARLLASRDCAERDEAWAAFLGRFSLVLLRVAHSLGGDRDAAMDRYSYVLEWLRRDDFARLRTFVPDGRCRFSTWLFVVARRLCLDHRRRQYGHGHGSGREAGDRRVVRARLTELVGERIDLLDLADSASAPPDHQLRSDEVRRALSRALEGLGARDRLLLKLRFEFDMPGREIAGVMQFPSVFHVYRRLNRVLQGLRDALVRSGIDDATP